MAATVLRRMHNPRNQQCFCDASCWCRRTPLGRAVKWWFPARLFGIHHVSGVSAEWKREHDHGVD